MIFYFPFYYPCHYILKQKKKEPSTLVDPKPLTIKNQSKMQAPDPLHANFFSSLKQVEKRLKLETPSPQQHHHDHSLPQQNQNQSLQQENSDTQAQSLSTPLYLHHPNPTPTPTPTLNQQGSETPQEFLSNSFHFSPTQENPPPSNQEKVEASDVNDNDANDIQVLMQLLGLEDDDEKEPKRVGLGCDEGFYGKIVGVKGPKSDEQAERLNRWIKHFLNRGGNDGVKQPLRLAHLLLAKAAFVDDFDAFEFPSTVDEYLEHDPPLVVD